MVYVAVTGRKHTLFHINKVKSPASIPCNFMPELGTLLADRSY